MINRPVWRVVCPRCGAQVGTSCTYPNGTLRAAHQERINAYRKTPEGDPWKDDSNKSTESPPGTVNTG